LQRALLLDGGFGVAEMVRRDRDGAVSRTKIASLVHAMHQLGDIDDEPSVDRLVLSGVTQLTN